MESDAAIEPSTAPQAQKESWWATLRFLFLLFLAALALRTFIVAPFSIPSGSMLPRLYIGDYLFVSKWSYGYSRYAFPFGLGRFDGRIVGSLPSRGVPDVAGGHVQVTAYGTEDADYCKVGSWSTGGADFSATVRCYNHQGVPSDNRFDLLFVW